MENWFLDSIKGKCLLPESLLAFYWAENSGWEAAVKICRNKFGADRVLEVREYNRNFQPSRASHDFHIFGGECELSDTV